MFLDRTCTKHIVHALLLPCQSFTTPGNCQIKYFQPACEIPPGATLRITVTEPEGRNYVYASTTTSQPGPYNYEYRNESAGTKTLLIPYSAGYESVVVAVKGAAAGTATFTLDAWVDVFDETQSTTIQVRHRCCLSPWPAVHGQAWPP